MTTGVQVFLMAFGAILALIGVVVFFLLAWFKETTGQDHQNAIKILQAEFRFSNPALVIFAGGLILMITPIVLGQTTQANPPPTPTPSVGSITPVLPDTPSSDSGQIIVDGPTPTLVTPTQEPTPTAIPEPPTPTPTPTTEPPTPTPTAAPPPLPDPTGRWWNQAGFLEFRRIGDNEFEYRDFNNFRVQVGEGTATQDEYVLHVTGEGLFVNIYGNSYYSAYTGEITLDGNVLEGYIYDTFGNSLPVFFTRDTSGFGQ